jgi:hypothetical protein
MVTKKQNEVILYFTEEVNNLYLARLFKLIYLFELKIYEQTKNRFFKTDFIADIIAPIPIDIWENIVNGKLLSKYPDYEIYIPPNKKFNFRNIKDIKIQKLRKANLEMFSNDELNVLEFISKRYKDLLPSAIYENKIFKKQIYRDMIEDGNEGKIIDLNDIFKLN